MTIGQLRPSPPLAGRVPVARRAALAVAWVTLGLVVVSIMSRVPLNVVYNGDTIALVKGAPTIATCLDRGVFTRCNHYAGAHHLPGISQFPLIQTVPALLLHLSGLDADRTIAGLRWLNFFVELGIVALVLRWCYRRSGPSLTVLGGLLLIPGMLVAYSVESLGEPLAVASFVGLVLAGLRRDRVSFWLAPVAAVATVSKETAAPFVLVFGLAAIVLSGAELRVCRRAVIALVAGIVVGVALDAGFNMFRYGTLLNHVYLDYPRQTHAMAVVNSAALLVSPNGGIVWFWPGVGVALAILVTVAVRRPRSHGWLDGRRKRIGVLVALLAFAANVVSLGDWWDPMGWYAWGPRLLIPAAAPIVVLALPVVAARPNLRIWPSVGATVALIVVSVAVLLPTLGLAFGLGSQSSMVEATWSYKPACLADRPKIGSSLFGTCLRLEEWRTVGMPLVDSVPHELRYRRYWLTVFGAAATMIVWAGLVVRERPDHPSPTGALPWTK